MRKIIYEPEFNSILGKWVVVVGKIIEGKLRKTPHFFVNEEDANQFILDISKEEK